MSSVRTATSTKMARPSRTRRNWLEAFGQRQLMDLMNVRRSFCGPLADRPMMRMSLASQGTRSFVDCSEERRLRLEELLATWWGGVERRLMTGTMMMGSHHTREESFALLDFAFENGVTLFDTAEMYPVPQCSETHGRSEEILEQWMRQHQRQQAPTSRGSFSLTLCFPEIGSSSRRMRYQSTGDVVGYLPSEVTFDPFSSDVRLPRRESRILIGGPRSNLLKMSHPRLQNARRHTSFRISALPNCAPLLAVDYTFTPRQLWDSFPAESKTCRFARHAAVASSNHKKFFVTRYVLRLSLVRFHLGVCLAATGRPAALRRREEAPAPPGRAFPASWEVARDPAASETRSRSTSTSRWWERARRSRRGTSPSPVVFGAWTRCHRRSSSCSSTSCPATALRICSTSSAGCS